MSTYPGQFPTEYIARAKSNSSEVGYRMVRVVKQQPETPSVHLAHPHEVKQEQPISVNAEPDTAVTTATTESHPPVETPVVEPAVESTADATPAIEEAPTKKRTSKTRAAKKK